jgi:hypothetical protein
MQAPARIANILMSALKGGVVPRVGLEYITVGRAAEVEAILSDIELIATGGASFRFVVGRYGAGKSFLLQTIRNFATASGFAVVDADLSPERRFAGTKGQGLATYRELVQNLSVKSKPDGGALALVLDKWIAGGAERVAEVAALLTDMVGGFEFARALEFYLNAHNAADPEAKNAALKFFRGEYVTRAEAKAALGINFIVNDENWYDCLKILAALLTGAGYKGLVVFVDELVNIFKIPNSISRNNNYEKILTMYNDVLQGKARHIGFLMGGTPQCIEDKYRGVYSYEALRSRLAEGHFATAEVKDMTAPVIRLSMLTQEEMYVLVEKLMTIHAGLHGYTPRLSHEDLLYFLTVEYNRVGADTHITPREIIRDFIELLGILHQNPTLNVREILGDNSFAHAKGGITDEEIHEDFAEFEL